MDVIYGASVKGNGEDKLCYRPNKKNGFIVSGYYWVLLCIMTNLFLGNRRFLLELLSLFALMYWRKF